MVWITCRRILIVIVSSFLFINVSIAQYKLEGFSVSDSTQGWLYSNLDPLNTKVVDGSYVELGRKISNSHPFFLQGNWTTGDIYFKNKLYTEQKMILDLEKNILYLGVTNEKIVGVQPILINQSHISYFTIYNRTFKYISTSKISIPSGLYEIIYEGNQISMFANRIKSLHFYVKYSSYVESDKYYMMMHNKLYPYRRRGDLLRLYPEQKKNIKKFIRTNKLNTQKGNDSSLSKIIEYCNSL
ncbi:MAG: hypothetical protein OEW75_12400 [Cyclobacteriaceae bacterium]|nr:hypothetical protein [Cyclobacteriaceae bacterium]